MPCRTCCRSSASPTMPPCCSPRCGWWRGICVRSTATPRAPRSRGSRRVAHSEGRRSALPVRRSPLAMRELYVARVSHPHHQLAHHLAVRECLERGRQLGKRINLLDVARQLALGTPMSQRIDGGLEVLRVVANPLSPEHAEHGAALEQHEI